MTIKQGRFRYSGTLFPTRYAFGQIKSIPLFIQCVYCGSYVCVSLQQYCGFNIVGKENNVRLLARKTNCLDNKETLSIATAVGIVHYMKISYCSLHAVRLCILACSHDSHVSQPEVCNTHSSVLAITIFHSS